MYIRDSRFNHVRTASTVMNSGEGVCVDVVADFVWPVRCGLHISGANSFERVSKGLLLEPDYPSHRLFRLSVGSRVPSQTASAGFATAWMSDVAVGIVLHVIPCVVVDFLWGVLLLRKTGCRVASLRRLGSRWRRSRECHCVSAIVVRIALVVGATSTECLLGIGNTR